MEVDIDIDKLIVEVQKHPAIWNSKSAEYNDRFEKIKQWEAVVNSLIDPYLSIEEKKVLGHIVQKRWRTIRDAFVKQRRELAQAAEAGKTIPNKKIYKYYKQLMFLIPIVGCNTSTSTTESVQENVIHIDIDAEDVPQSSSSVQSPASPPAKKIKNADKIERELANVLKCTLAQKYGENDPDRQFMLSLVEDLKMVPPRLKSQVKMNILKCIMEAQREEEVAREQIHQEEYTIISLPDNVKHEA
ncbi:uncharacterized protein LOC121727003 [Aricia agestis]|uniref:uncharacterized protein LOC121727003 n=1 Tax=Aricia agestis TaxID=91739 RepID=UPI001C205D1D|nr:uncharacterized protein LOC121727003 [Aricia agestis]